MDYKPAGFWKRVVAQLIDSIVLGAILTPIMVIVLGIFGGAAALFVQQTGGIDNIEPNAGFIASIAGVYLLLFALQFLAMFFYYKYFYARKGATPGKLIFDMKVIKISSGQTLKGKDVFMREILGKFLSGILFAIGYLIIGFRKDKKGLHDMISDTQVLELVK